MILNSFFLTQKNLDGEAEVLLDPNKLSDDGTVALSMASISKDGQYLAYGLSASGSDWVTIKVMKVDDRTPEPDTLSWVGFVSSYTCLSLFFLKITYHTMLYFFFTC